MNSPAQIVSLAAESAVKKASLPIGKVLMLAFLAGVYIAMGGLLSLLIGFGFPEITAGNPGLQRMLSGIFFPVGLILVVFAGAELFTGNNAILMPAVWLRRCSWSALLRNWGLVYLGNFLGALFFVLFLVWLPGIVAGSPWHEAITGIAVSKTTQSFGVIFLKGVGANWLVCLAVWLGLSSKSASGKAIGLWFPVMAFVAMGYEHSIANMFFIPLGMLSGAPVSVGAFVINNLIPATLGNIVGGALFVGTLYTWIYRRDLTD